jgi:hypothetical protein
LPPHPMRWLTNSVSTICYHNQKVSTRINQKYVHENSPKKRNSPKVSTNQYRHSLIYAVNMGTQKKNRGSKNRVNLGYLVVLKGRKIIRIINRSKLKTAKIETAEIEACLYLILCTLSSFDSAILPKCVE